MPTAARRRAALLSAVGILLLLVPAAGERYLVYLASQIIIFALFALSYNLLLGFGGLVSFGHAAYFAIGAYGVAILGTSLNWPFAAALAGAVVLSAAAALAIGYFCVRLTTIYFAMLTLAFAQFVWAIAFKWRTVTRGDTGFIGVALPEFLTVPTNLYYFVLAVSAASGAILWLVVHSAFGRALVATRENPIRAEFVGLNVRQIRLVAFVIAGLFAGLAGTLFTAYNRSVFPDFAWWTKSAEVLIMTVLGGMHSFFGPVIGAAALIVLERLTTDLTQYWPTVLGAILLIVLFVFPDGLIGLARPWQRAWGIRRNADDPKSQ